VTWSRREVLTALGSGAATTLLWACRHPAPRAARPVRPEQDVAGLRARLREVVVRLTGSFARVGGLAAARTHTVAGADAGGRTVRQEARVSLVLFGVDGAGRRFERVTDDLTADRMHALGDELIAGRGRTNRVIQVARPIERRYRASDDPVRAGDDQWAAHAEALYRRAEGAGSSRIVYRAGYLEVDDESVWFFGDAGEGFQRLVRTRAGALMVAWSGARPVAAAAEVAAPIGLAAAAQVTDVEIAAAAARAEELMTPTAAPHGELDVVLDPSVAGAVIDAGVAALMTAGAWRRVDLAARRPWRASAELTVVDDPAAASYAGYAFDDEGAAATRAVLIDGGAPGAPLAVDPLGRGRGHARRPGHVGAVRAAPSHVVIAPGAPGLADLIAGVDRGLLVEAAGPARVDPIRWQVVVPVGVGRRLERGRRTGHVHADLELRAEVPALLGGVTAASREVRAIARREVLDGEPLWRSTSSPWLVTRAAIAPRRGGG
jgi:PmbA/TldA metallopeptidase C-terminal domain